jgi:hypothetical protein
MTREEVVKLGNVFVHPAPPVERRWQLCWCGVCGTIGRCTPANDFYHREGEDFLRCKSCVTEDPKRRGTYIKPFPGAEP